MFVEVCLSLNFCPCLMLCIGYVHRMDGFQLFFWKIKKIAKYILTNYNCTQAMRHVAVEGTWVISTTRGFFKGMPRHLYPIFILGKNWSFCHFLAVFVLFWQLKKDLLLRKLNLDMELSFFFSCCTWFEPVTWRCKRTLWLPFEN